MEGVKYLKSLPYVDEDSGTISIKVEIDKQLDYLKQDLSVINEIIIEKFSKVIVIGKEYLIPNEKNRVIRYRDGEVAYIDIKINKEIGGKVIVDSGLSEGDILILPEKVDGKGKIIIKN